MITIKIKDHTIELTGHARRDICSSVSTLMCTVYNILDKINGKNNFEYNDDGDTMLLSVKDSENNGINYMVFDVIVDELTDLSNDYPDFVKIIKEK